MKHRTGLPWPAWLALLGPLASLVAEVVVALRDGRVSPDETREIGAKLIELVAHAGA